MKTKGSNLNAASIAAGSVKPQQGTINAQQTNPIQTPHPTDSYIPSHLSDLIPELNSYQELLEAEKKLDIYMTRKKIDLYQSVSQWNNSKHSETAFSHYNKDSVNYLRIFISNTAENQPWQDPNGDISNATWTMRVEGRLLDSAVADNAARPKFSSFIQDIAVDFKKTSDKEENAEQKESSVDSSSVSQTPMGLTLPLHLPELTQQQNTKSEDNNAVDEESNIYDAVEWHFDPKNPVEFDGLDIKRSGSQNVECTVTIQPKGYTGAFLQYSPELSLLIGKSQGSLPDAVYALYKYILLNHLLINDDSTSKGHESMTNGERTIVEVNDGLNSLLPAANEKPTTLKLSEIPPLINSHISPIKPIKVDYTIRVDKASTYGKLVFDIEVPDLAMQSKAPVDELGREGRSLLTEIDKLTAELNPKLQDLEKQINNYQLQLNLNANKYGFFKKLSEDPALVLREYMESSSNALKVLSGDEGYNEDTVRRSQFYKDNEAMLFENLGILLSNGRI
ncbi:hypothetical protein KAFR_0J02520 [Kazachstania africana CBS 2517]|uniref:DM2 domain-containing protein n=1 Tax=Kazachstania africana (strain ATCC 22294 / BCRC 22015 / CBS 2517 / CECT 1963 / NBRC 1671 / NRRL Y-8276) TaxID=1071382 RepID=H2B116_KAZAF|nr:hypothetical protein KAFR_0J02520 [Kazachstania africana CBS 2517]CCF60316.1 hypothetical protein KAFR_0J02520 [Kazachstania africana CBS 2517]